MKLFTLLAAWLLCTEVRLLPQPISAATLTSVSTVESSMIPVHREPQYKRKMQMENEGHENHFFRPLSCNSELALATCTPWTPTKAELTSLVTIPCGECRILVPPLSAQNETDTPTTVEFLEGLDIQGMLSILEGTEVNILSPFILVQGVLHMHNEELIHGTPKVKVMMTGGPELNVGSMIHEENKMACPSMEINGTSVPVGKHCDVSNRAVVVAGGSLKVQGYASGCPTWTHLLDVELMDLPLPPQELPQDLTAPSTPGGCVPDDVFGHYFDSGFAEGWYTSGGSGSIIDNEDEGGSFEVVNRPGYYNGPARNINPDEFPCLQPWTHYIMEVRYMIVPSNQTLMGHPTHCKAGTGTCIRVRVNRPYYGNWRTIWTELREKAGNYGEWKTQVSTFQFDQHELDTTLGTNTWLFNGPPVEENIVLDYVLLKRVSSNAYPDNSDPEMCQDLITNGNADLGGFSTLPIWPSLGNRLYVEFDDESSDPFFRATGRTVMRETLAAEIITGCIQRGASYRYGASLRIHTMKPDVKACLEIQKFDEVGSSWPHTPVGSIGCCPVQNENDDWVNCSGSYTFPLNWDAWDESARYRIIFAIVGDNNAVVDYDNIFMTYQSGATDRVVLPGNVDLCWGSGSEVVFPSFGIDWEGSQVRTITNISLDENLNRAILSLDQPIMKPTTVQESADFASEVALLSRNIRFEPDWNDNSTDSVEMRGGHLIVLHTPGGEQSLEGVEVRHFGQRGILGRYPLHFHMCDNVEGSVFRNNLIRDSNQRCVVVHGTHNATIQGNVAFNTFGHCFMTEDGVEMDNKFLGNFGAHTKRILTEHLPGDDETDSTPSTFWMSNPNNVLEDNCAAGSEDSGFWYELRKAVRGPSAELDLAQGMNPKFLPLQRFRGNVAHSNRMMGVRTYPTGFDPPVEAVLSGGKSYRNRHSGMLFHGTSRVLVRDYLFADNSVNSIDIDLTDNARVDAVTIMGYTPLYRTTVENQLGGSQSPCNAYHGRGRVDGIDLYTYLRREEITLNNREYWGAHISNVNFEHFDTGCPIMTEFSFNHFGGLGVRTGIFNYETEITNVTISSGMPMDVCAASKHVDDVVIHDTDGSMKPNSLPGSGELGFILSNTTAMKTFLQMSQCVTLDVCSIYCGAPDLCLRTVKYGVPYWGTTDLKLMISDGTNELSVSGDFWMIPLINATGGDTLDENGNVVPDHQQNANAWKYRYFAVTIPAGPAYTASFTNTNGETVWPTMVEEFFDEHTLCPQGPKIDLVEPDVGSETCEELIKNGDPLYNSFEYWSANNGGLVQAVPSDLGGYALRSFDRSSYMSGAGQFLDTRCISEGTKYLLKAQVKLVPKNDLNSFVVCDTNHNDHNKQDVCPTGSLTSRIRNEQTKEYEQHNIYHFAKVVPLFDQGAWHELQGEFTVTSEMANATSVLVHIARANTNVNIVVDKVTITPYKDEVVVPQGEGENSTSLIKNGQFTAGNSLYWNSFGSSELTIVESSADYAIEVKGRSGHTDGVVQIFPTSTLIEGETYEIEGKFQLRNQLNEYFPCDPSACYECIERCPDIRLNSRIGGNQAHNMVAASIARPVPNPPGWSSWYGTFIANDIQQTADEVWFLINNAAPEVDIIIEEVSLEQIEVPQPCSGLIQNGNAISGTAEKWYGWGASAGTSCPGSDGNDCALKASGRTRNVHGLAQNADTSCFVQGDVWKISARFKLVDDNGDGMLCDPIEGPECPFVRILSSEAGQSNHEHWLRDATMSWNKDFFNFFSVGFVVTEQIAAFGLTRFMFIGGDPSLDLMVDDVSITKIGSIMPQETCSNLIRNGDASYRSDQFWSGYAASIGVSCPGSDGNNCALRAWNRAKSHHGLMQTVGPTCFEEGDTWIVKARFKLLDESENPVQCDAVNGPECPFVRIMSTQSGQPTQDLWLRDATMAWDVDKFNSFNVGFSVTDRMASYSTTKFMFVGSAPGLTILADDVSIEKTSTTEAPATCDNLIRNGNIMYRSYQFWSGFGASIGVLCPGQDGAGPDGNDCALRTLKRTKSHHGFQQVIGPTCLVEGDILEIKASFKLIDSYGNPVQCNPAGTDCPFVRMRSTQAGSPTSDQWLRDHEMTWNSSQFNSYRKEIIVSNALATYGTTTFYFVGGSPEHTLLLDNASIINLSSSETSG